MTFIINNILWHVIFVSPVSNKLRRSDNSVTVGMTEMSTHTIYLSDMLQGAFLRKVFIHEVCHAECMSRNITMSIDQEERLCDFVASFGDEIFSIVDDLFVSLRRIA